MATAGDDERAAPYDDDSGVREWRREELLRAGYQLEHAEALGGRRDVDLHRARELVERGCAPDLAARILL